MLHVLVRNLNRLCFRFILFCVFQLIFVLQVYNIKLVHFRTNLLINMDSIPRTRGPNKHREDLGYLLLFILFALSNKGVSSK